jgi:acetylglutamate kinase
LIVHGGAPGVGAMLSRMGAGPKMASAASRTDADLKVVEMVLSGSVNSELVTLLNQEGGHAVGLSGKDGALLRAKLRESSPPQSAAGDITRVNKDFLEMLLSQKYIPVVSPIGIGENGNSYNLDADDVAAEIAVAIKASKLIYLVDVPGMQKNGELIPELSVVQLEQEVGSNDRGTGASILRAVRGGVDRIHVIDGRVPHSVIAELFTDRGVGTLITR